MNGHRRQHLRTCRFVNMIDFAEYFAKNPPITALILTDEYEKPRPNGRGCFYLGFFMVREMRFLRSSTSSTHTVTMSPTESTSEG